MVGLYVTHSYTLQYLHIMHINISKTVYRISLDKYIYASVTHGGKTATLKISTGDLPPWPPPWPRFLSNHYHPLQPYQILVLSCFE
mgnify:CR=1 FL=1